MLGKLFHPSEIPVAINNNRWNHMKLPVLYTSAMFECQFHKLQLE